MEHEKKENALAMVEMGQKKFVPVSNEEMNCQTK
jgi:hypothetical protein